MIACNDIIVWWWAMYIAVNKYASQDHAINNTDQTSLLVVLSQKNCASYQCKYCLHASLFSAIYIYIHSSKKKKNNRKQQEK